MYQQMDGTSSVVKDDLSSEAFRGNLAELGWQGKFKYDDPEVVNLRSQLQAEAGIPQLEIVDPVEEGFAQRAKQLLTRDGFVLVRDVLDAERLAKLRRGCEIVIREMVGRDPHRLGNRGSHRYSFGQAPAHFGRQDEWATMIDPPILNEVLKAVFETDDYVCVNGVVGGDFNCPGSVEYQHLHSDGGGASGTYPDVKFAYQADGTRRKVAVDAEEDASLRYEVVNMRDVPVREHHVTANFPLEICRGSSVGHTAYNGVTRQIPGTQSLDSRNGNPIPPEEAEPLWMKLSTTGPCPAGSVLLRDSRAWHGGTPNLGEFVRAIPCAIFALPPDVGGTLTGWSDPIPNTLPYETWQNMTEHGKHICRMIVAQPGATIKKAWRPDWEVEEALGGGGETNAAHQGQVVARL